MVSTGASVQHLHRSSLWDSVLGGALLTTTFQTTSPAPPAHRDSNTNCGGLNTVLGAAAKQRAYQGVGSARHLS